MLPSGWEGLSQPARPRRCRALEGSRPGIAGRRRSAETGVWLLLWGLHRDGGCGLGSTGCLGGLLLEPKEGPGVTGEADSNSGAGRATVEGRGGLCFGFSRPGRSLVGVSRLPAGATQGLSDSTQDPDHSPPPACTRHPHHEIEFIADSNTFKSIYCKITFQ